MTQLVTVGIPVYFNEGSLPALARILTKVNESLKTLDTELELVFVDDGSGDNSYAELLKIRDAFARTTVIRHTRNFGALQAIKTALDHATGDCFVILSADLQDPPELIEMMVKEWLAGSKFVICQRRSRADPVATRFFARVYYWMVRRFVIPGYPAGGFDFSLMGSDMMALLRRSPKNVNFVMFAYWLGFKPAVIEYDRIAREHGVSRWTFSKKFKLFIDTFLGFSVAPIRLISGIGAVVAVMSFLYGVFEIIAAISGIVPVPGFATLVTLITFLLGLIILFLGIIAEYLWRILYEVNRVPESVIDEVIPSRKH